jgi:DNA-binding LytR/AlgR family response regulator
MGDVIPGDIEDAAIIKDAADDDVGVGMTGIVMVDRYPVEPRGEIQFHLAHEVAGKAAKVSHFGGILRRHDEAKLVAIFPAALHKGLAVDLVLEAGIGLAPVRRLA